MDAVELLSPLQTLLKQWPMGFEEYILGRMAAGNPEARTLNKLLGPWYILLRKHCQDTTLEPFLEVQARSIDALYEGLMHRAEAAHSVDEELVLQSEFTSRRLGVGAAIQSVMRAARDGELVAVVKGPSVGKLSFLRSEVAQYLADHLAGVELVGAKPLSNGLRRVD